MNPDEQYIKNHPKGGGRKADWVYVPEPTTPFAFTIASRRLELGLHGKEIARRAGVSVGIYCLWETGKIENITLKNFLALAKALEIEPHDFLKMYLSNSTK